MAVPFNPIGPTPVGPTGPGQTRPESAGAADGSSFKDVLHNSINEVNRLQQEATQATEDLVAGRTQDVGQVLAASQKAEVAFQMLMEIRNKLVTAYDELRQMRL
jgi:flagellar hook-basal body complex protein FliE